MRIQLTYFIQSFIIILFTVFFISSCGSDDPVTNTPAPEPVDTSSFEYPFTIGTSWNYSLSISAENIRPDSVRYYFNSYPVTGYGYSEILYDTVVAPGGPARVLYDRLIIGSDTTASRYYYTNNEYSMVCYGFRGSTGASFPFRKLNIPYSNFNGLISENITNNYRSVSDTFISLSPPVIVIKYPVIRNTEWVIFNFGVNDVKKRYTAWEKYQLDTAVIPVIQTQRIWSNNSDWILYDYYSKYGQMKRNYLFKNTQLTNQFGITIGNYDKREVYNVTSYSIIAK